MGFEYYLVERHQTFWLLYRLSSALHERLIGPIVILHECKNSCLISIIIGLLQGMAKK